MRVYFFLLKQLHKENIMEFQNNQVEFLGLAPSNEEDMLRAIEEAGRTCYRSEDLITPISYRAFFLKLFKRTHFSVLEHGNIVLRIPRDKWPSFYHNMIELIHITKQGGFFEVAGYKNNFYVAGNLRAWIMLLVHIHKITGGDLPRNPLALALFMHLLKFYPFIFGAVSDTIPSDIVHYRTLDYPEMELVDEKEQMRLLIESNFKLNLPLFIFRVKTNRGNTHEVVRNRTLGFSHESTRYVNYFKKIGLRFFDDFKRLIAKPGLSEELISDTKDALLKFYTGVENLYNHLVDGTNGPQILTPEFARNILPNSLMSEIIISGRLGHGDDYAGYDLSSQFTHFIKQRGSDAAHPDIRPIAALMFKHIDELLSAKSFPKDDK
jgi:thymidylate synthase ThyX